MKKIIPIIFIVFLLIAGVFVLQNHLSYRDISIRYGENISGIGVVILKGDQRIKDVGGDSIIRIKAGDYTLKTEGSDDYEHYEFNYTVKDNEQEIFINPNFSKQKLATLLKPQEDAIFNIIKNNIPLGNTYKVNPGSLYKHGEWYGTTIVPSMPDEELRLQYVDVFRVVLNKKGDDWELVTPTPQLVLNKADFPNIPTDVLSQTNRQYGETDTPF